MSTCLVTITRMLLKSLWTWCSYDFRDNVNTIIERRSYHEEELAAWKRWAVGRGFIRKPPNRLLMP